MAGGIQLAPLLTQIKVDLKSFKSDMDKVKTEAVGKAKEVSKSMEGAAKIGKTMTDIGGTMTKKLTLPIVGAGVAAAKFSMDFSDSLAKVSTIADTTKVPIDVLKKGVMDLSYKTGMSATELNEGLYQAISGSVDTAKAVDFLGVAVKAAKGGFTDTTTAVDGLTTVLNSYGLQADKADKIANQMLITQNKGKTTFGQLAGAMGQVTPIAAQLDIKTEELFSSLASTTAQGLDTSESVTALKSAMSNIIKPSEEASKAAEQLGIDFSVSALKSKGWMGFLQDVKKGLANASPEFDKLSKKMTENANKMLELEKAGQKGSQEYKNLTKAQKNLTKDLEILAQAADSPIGGMASLFGNVRALNGVLMLTSDNGMKIYNDTMKEMKTNTTALNDAFNKMDKTPGQEMKKALNDIKNLGIEMGDILMPVIRDVMRSFRGMAQGFKNLSPHTKEAIVKTALFTATIGPLLSVTGKTITAFTKLKPIVSGLGVVFGSGTPIIGKYIAKLGLTKAAGATATKAIAEVGTTAATAGGAGGLGALSSSLATIAPVALPAIAIIGGVGLAAYGIHKTLSQEVVPSVDLFADKVKTSSAEMMNYNTASQNVETANVKISESTKKAVGAYMDLDKQSSQSVMNLYTNSNLSAAEITKFTDETSSKFKTMSEQIVQGYEKQKNDSISMLQEQYLVSGELTSQEMANILQKTNNFYTQKQQTTQQLEAQIQQILQNASDNHKQLKDSEVQTITQLQEKMRQNAVTSLSSSEIEQKVIMERLKSYSGRITTEQASETIRNAEQQRIKSVDSANRQYLETKAKIEYQRDVVKSLTKDQADKLIESAERQRKESVEKASNQKTEVVKKIKSMNSETVENVDTSTGKILTFWDTMMRKWNEWNPQPKKFSFTYMENKVNASKADGSKYNGLSYVPFDGYTARLHKGERVLTANENRDYIQGNNSSKGVNVINNFYGRVDSPYEVAKASKKVMRDLSFG